MNTNANKISCALFNFPNEERFAEHLRPYQGVPTLAITNGGRIFAGWYAGGIREPHIDNYCLLIYSDDKGRTWSEPVIIIPSSREHFIHTLDIQLWVDPDGKLHVFWVQNNCALASDPKPDVKPEQPWIIVDGYQFYDFEHSQWESVCDNPDAEVPEFSEARFLYQGFLRNNPIILKSGIRLDLNYDQLNDRYGYSVSDDGGKTFERRYGSKKIATPFDEAMAYQLNDGRVRFMARAEVGYIAQSFLSDNCEAWSETTLTDIANPNTRFYVGRTPSGRVILVNNDNTEKRNNLTVYLSEDDGFTWKYKKVIDARMDVSYPDIDFYNGRIYLIYDRERTAAREILFTSFTEEDIMNDNYKFNISIVSKVEER